MDEEALFIQKDFLSTYVNWRLAHPNASYEFVFKKQILGKLFLQKRFLEHCSLGARRTGN